MASPGSRGGVVDLNSWDLTKLKNTGKDRLSRDYRKG